jgi:hyperosmotically inducible protein
MSAFAGHPSETNLLKQEKQTESLLEKNVRRELTMLSNYTVFDNLEFRIEDGHTAILYGQVNWPQLKNDAENAVKLVKGIDRVVNNIEILPLSPFDNTIRKRVFLAIYGQVGFERYAIQAVPPIHIIVNNGVVTLVGVVADQIDKNAVGLAANNVSNVFKVNNELRVIHKD